ncbi:unnamed protein product [Effrenium voratum]|nr:unnamed protein product [Effrenium voratum]
MPKPRRLAQVEDMLTRAAAASSEAPNRGMKRRIRQRLHKKLGLMMAGEEFEKAVERFKALEGDGEKPEATGVHPPQLEGHWPICSVQDVCKVIEEPQVTAEVLQLDSEMMQQWHKAMCGTVPVRNTFVHFGTKATGRRSRSI